MATARKTSSKALDPALRKYFDEKVRTRLVAKGPATSKSDGLKKRLADYKAISSRAS